MSTIEKIYVKYDEYGDVAGWKKSTSEIEGMEEIGEAIYVSELSEIDYIADGENQYCAYCGGIDDYVDADGTIYSPDYTRGTNSLDIEKSNVLFHEQGLMPFDEWGFDPELHSGVHLITYEWDGNGYRFRLWWPEDEITKETTR